MPVVLNENTDDNWLILHNLKLRIKKELQRPLSNYRYCKQQGRRVEIWGALQLSSR